jgi:type II secretory pathway component PulC
MSIGPDVTRRAFEWTADLWGLTRAELRVRGGNMARAFALPLRWCASVRPRLSSALGTAWKIVRRTIARDIAEVLSPLLVLNVFLVGVSAVLLFSVVRTLMASDRLPPIPASRPAEAVPSAPNAGGTRARASAGYDVIAARNLFDPSRSEPARSARRAQDAAPQAKLVLYGLVLSDDPGLGLAYLEDPRTGRITGYRVGDPLAGGRVERIERDRVLIRRAGELVEVLLNRSHTPPPDSVPVSSESTASAVPWRRIPKD